MTSITKQINLDETNMININEKLVATNDTKKEFKTFTVSDELCFVIYNEDFREWHGYYPYYEKCSYSVKWPDKGMMSDKAMKELMAFYFNVEPTTDINKACKEWREHVINQTTGQIVKSIDENKSYAFSEVSSECRQDGNIATFNILHNSYLIGAAHGFEVEICVTVDVATGEIIHLVDLIDTSRLGYVIARAIQDLEVNSDIKECLFDQNVDEIPCSDNFFIDSTHSAIYIGYTPYDITPYACGMQWVCLPIYWLSKHTSLTPYAKKILESGCLVKDKKE